jgi:hypothetical protein
MVTEVNRELDDLQESLDKHNNIQTIEVTMLEF